MKRALVLVVLALVVDALAPAALAESERREPPQTPPTPTIDAQEWLTRAAYLASDEMVGRESGTEAGRATEEYVAAEFRRMGLEPLGSDGSFFQDVPLPSRNPDPAGTVLSLAIGDGAPTTLGEVTDVMPFGFSIAGEVSGELAFAGFGLTDPKNGYDDYFGLETEGKVLLILRHGPDETDPESPWSPQNPQARQMMRMLAFTAKATRAAAADAAAVLIVNDYNHAEDSLPVTVRGRTSTIPVIAISRGVADALLADTGTTLRELQAAIDSDRKPRSRAFPGRTVTVRASIEAQRARNVLAVRRGSDPKLRGEAVVIGAHLDHVGMGWFGSPAGGGKIHNGADDNASGTAALLEAAEWVASRPASPRSIVFAAWCGEEKGLVGSRHFVKTPRWPIADTVACVNLDMVGRYRSGGPKDQGMKVGGAPTGVGLSELIEGIASDVDVQMTHTWDAWQQSDHYPFYAADVPALFLTTGLHPQYHRPEDDWWLLEPEGAARVARVAARLIERLAGDGARPEFVARPPRPVLGVRLAEDPERDGALLGFIFPDMAASKAGAEAGDLVVGWNETPVVSAAALGKIIGEHAPGDVVRLKVVRGDAEIVLELKLGAPRRNGR